MTTGSIATNPMEGDPLQLALFDLPLTTCDCCDRLIPVAATATHACFFLD